MPDAEPDSEPSVPRRRRGWKLLAVLAGLIGTALSLAVPFLPVQHDITTLTWPTTHGTQAVSAPLSAFSPQHLDVRIPCSAARDLDARQPGHATLLNTNPPNAKYGARTGMQLEIADGKLNLTSRGQQLGTAELGGGNCTITVRSDGYTTSAQVGDREFVHLAGDHRPQVTGIFSDLDAAVDDINGVSVRAEVDNRYQSYATPLKIAAIVGALLSFLTAVLVLRRFDVFTGRRPRRFAPVGWWKPTFPDIAVLSALIIWWLIGAMTADDGYFLTIARVRDEIGYVSDFYRWYSVAYAPMAWFAEPYSWWVQVSTATPWVRLPSLFMGITSWLLISREVLPRLGQRVRRSHAARWAAGAVFLAFWLPYDNGLRPEPVVVVFALLTLCLVERTVATSRLVPASVGLVTAALAVTANPHGMIALLPFIVALKPLLRLLRKRAREYGWLPLLAPIAACGVIVLTVVFADQTWQATMDATDIRKQLGPDGKWYQELIRYSTLFSQTPDGSLTRRFPVLLVILCIAACGVVLLRKGRIRGAALGPSRRLIGIAALSFVVLMLTPTKHTHHFGIFAAIGGALAALTALATSSTVLHSRRNRAVFFAGLTAILALAATGTNSWWYVSGWGVPWFDAPPSIAGVPLSTALLVLTGIALVVSFIEHLRIDEHAPELAFRERSRGFALGVAPLSIICALLVVLELATFVKVFYEQHRSFNLGTSNVQAISGRTCGLSDYVYVEQRPLDGMLVPSSAQPREPRLTAKMDGFRRDGLPPGRPGEANSEWRPPHQMGGDTAPVWGSYHQTGQNTGTLRTDWYTLPKRAKNHSVPIVIAVAGQEGGGNSIVAEFGRQTPRGFEVLERKPVNSGVPGPHWRDARIFGPKKADQVRFIAKDNVLGTDGWIAMSTPRVPQLTKLTDVIGDSPTFVEWPAALVHPCVRPAGVHNGISEMPQFRIAAGGRVRGMGKGWSAPEAGGQFGWMNVAASMRELPTYLKGNPHRDWGSLYAIDPYAPNALPASEATQVRTETHWGRWSPGPLTKPVQLPNEIPDSNDRPGVVGRTQP